MRKILSVSALALLGAVSTAGPAAADTAPPSVSLKCLVITVGQVSKPIIVTVCPPVTT